MMKLERPEMPEFLRLNYKEWGKRYYRKRNNPLMSNDFQWAKYNGRGVNRILLDDQPGLRTMTNDHCSFCDAFALESVGEEIEHFRSVSSKPLLSYYWGNLYHCCGNCNGHKHDSSERKLLRPDANNYSFEKYFIFDYVSGEINVNPALENESDREKANNTITLYGLNLFNRPNRRKHYLKQFQNTIDPDIEDFPYRFILI